MGVILRSARRAILVGAAVLALTAAAVMAFSEISLRADGMPLKLDQPVDAAVVLGGGIDPDGVLGYSSRRRVKVAVALLQTGEARNLIFSGGSIYGVGGSAAELMRDFAVGLGADPARLLIEPDSRSTFENLRFGFALAHAQGLERLALVTDAFHIQRAYRLARYFGRADTALVAIDGLRYDSPGNRAWSILREALAWWYNLYKIAGWEAMAAAGYSPAERGALIR